VLGTDTVYGIDMAGAFATLANEGERCEPHAIVEIVDRHGEVVYQHDGSCEQVLDAETAVRATEVLRGPIQNGTASSSARIGRPAAGKTGTTSEYGNAWFVGYVPQLAASVWAGNEEPADRFEHPACGGGVTGGCLPARMWATFMQEAVATLELPPEPFPSPPPLPTAEVPDVLGLDEEEAVADVEDAGFTPFAEQIEHHAEAGTVVEQEPEGGARKPEGSAVELAVSDGTGEPPVMPYLIGMSRDEALEILEQTGIEAEVEEVPVDDPDELDQVVGQSPTHGTELEGDDEDVTLEVGRPRRDDDPPPTPTPDPDDDDSGVELPTPAPPSDNEDEGHDSGDGDGGGDGIDLGDGHDDGGDSGDSGSDPGDDGTDGDAGSGDGDTGDGTDSGSDSGDGAGDGSGDSSGNGSGNGSGDSSGEDGGEDGS
jgi:membrane peptidoglycan carboxypeptidase